MPVTTISQTMTSSAPLLLCGKSGISAPEFTAEEQGSRASQRVIRQEPAYLKDEKLRLECERIAIGNAIQAGTLVEAADVEAGLSALLGGLRQAINNLPGRLADKMLHITDHHEAEEIIQEEMKVLLKTIQRREFCNSLKTPGA